MKAHISIITLGVKDVAKASQFYEKIGFEITRMADIAFIKTKGTWLSLYALESLAKDAAIEFPAKPRPTITLAHNVISKEQVDQVMHEIAEAGATVTDQPHEREWGGYSGYFQDLDGYLWEVAYNPYDPEIAVDETA